MQLRSPADEGIEGTLANHSLCAASLSEDTSMSYEAFDRLLSALKTFSSDAARALGKLGDLRAVPHLVERLSWCQSTTHGFSDPDFREACVTAIGLLGDGRAANAVSVELEKGADSFSLRTLAEIEEIEKEKAAAIAEQQYGRAASLRDKAAILTTALTAHRQRYSLGANLDDSRAANALIVELEKGADPRVRMASIRALGSLHDPCAVRALAKIISGRETSEVLLVAAESLVRLRAIDALAKVVETPEYDGYRKTLQENWRIVAEAAGALRDDRLARAFLPALHYSAEARAVAANALRRMGTIALPALVEGLKTTSSEGRKCVAELLTSLGWQPADADQEAWLALALCRWDRLAQLGIAAAAPLKYAASDFPAPPSGFSQALKQILDPRIVQCLIELTAIRKSSVDAVRALERILRASATRIGAQELRTLVTLRAHEIVTDRDQTGDEVSRTIEIDCSTVRTLAIAELTRRGIQV